MHANELLVEICRGSIDRIECSGAEKKVGICLGRGVPWDLVSKRDRSANEAVRHHVEVEIRSKVIDQLEDDLQERGRRPASCNHTKKQRSYTSLQLTFSLAIGVTLTCSTIRP